MRWFKSFLVIHFDGSNCVLCWYWMVNVVTFKFAQVSFGQLQWSKNKEREKKKSNVNVANKILTDLMTMVKEQVAIWYIKSKRQMCLVDEDSIRREKMGKEGNFRDIIELLSFTLNDWLTLTDRQQINKLLGFKMKRNPLYNSVY